MKRGETTLCDRVAPGSLGIDSLLDRGEPLDQKTSSRCLCAGKPYLFAYSRYKIGEHWKWHVILYWSDYISNDGRR